MTVVLSKNILRWIALPFVYFVPNLASLRLGYRRGCVGLKIDFSIIGALLRASQRKH
jgi:hypothetical protein